MNSATFHVLIPEILQSRIFAVVGASRDPSKFGNQVYLKLKHAGYTVFPVNPNADEIDGDPAYPHLDNLPKRPDCVVTVTPPEVTERVMQEAGHLQIPYCWMQEGSESEAAVNTAIANGMMVVYGG